MTDEHKSGLDELLDAARAIYGSDSAALTGMRRAYELGRRHARHESHRDRENAALRARCKRQRRELRRLNAHIRYIYATMDRHAHRDAMRCQQVKGLLRDNAALQRAAESSKRTLPTRKDIQIDLEQWIRAGCNEEALVRYCCELAGIEDAQGEEVDMPTSGGVASAHPQCPTCDGSGTVDEWVDDRVCQEHPCPKCGDGEEK